MGTATRIQKRNSTVETTVPHHNSGTPWKISAETSERIHDAEESRQAASSSECVTDVDADDQTRRQQQGYMQ
jgi:hypothetical protein